MNATQTYHPETLIVRRDGHIDDEYYDAVYQERKREALHAAGRELLRFTLITAPLQIGKGIVSLLSSETSHAE